MSSFRTHAPCPPCLRTPRSYPPRFHASQRARCHAALPFSLRGVMWPSQLQLSPPAHACRLRFSQASFRFRIHSLGGQQFSQLYSSARVSDCFDAMLCSCARCSSVPSVLCIMPCLSSGAENRIGCHDLPSRDDHASSHAQPVRTIAVTTLFAFAMTSFLSPAPTDFVTHCHFATIRHMISFPSISHDHSLPMRHTDSL